MEARIITAYLAMSLIAWSACDNRLGAQENGVIFHVSSLGCDSNPGSEQMG